MDSEQDVTAWLRRLRDGDREAVDALWHRYWKRVIGLARKRLGSMPRRVTDEEDAALSAFHSFCRGIEDGKLEAVADREDLWRVLAVITSRKVACAAREQKRLKRGGGRVRGESFFEQQDVNEGARGIEEVAARQIAAHDATDEIRRLLERLGDVTLQEIAVLKLEGHSNKEIAAKLDCGLRTIERKLQGIRAIWSEENAG